MAMDPASQQGLNWLLAELLGWFWPGWLCQDRRKPFHPQARERVMALGSPPAAPYPPVSPQSTSELVQGCHAV